MCIRDRFGSEALVNTSYNLGVDLGAGFTLADIDESLYTISTCLLYTSLFKTIEQGKFGGVKRPFDGGHGLEGVCTKGENYFNPFIELFMDHE